MSGVIDRVGPLAYEPAAGLSHFEAVARGITFQQLSGKAAETIYGRFRAVTKAPRPHVMIHERDQRVCSQARNRP